ncbi:MAG: hypothetical protein ACRDGM_05075, partial [bacterium]
RSLRSLGPPQVNASVRRTRQFVGEEIMRQCWADLQASVADCTRCASDLPAVAVNCPPGPLAGWK